tara:strand:+ start:322 stop:501 length:180 start_codon:yes stop_codon:yes gene_type:complete
MTDTETEARIHNTITKRWNFQLADDMAKFGVSGNSKIFRRTYKTPRRKPTAGAFGKKTK